MMVSFKIRDALFNRIVVQASKNTSKWGREG
jgi:hypothetical protein